MSHEAQLIASHMAMPVPAVHETWTRKLKTKHLQAKELQAKDLQAKELPWKWSFCLYKAKELPRHLGSSC